MYVIDHLVTAKWLLQNILQSIKPFYWITQIQAVWKSQLESSSSLLISHLPLLVAEIVFMTLVKTSDILWEISLLLVVSYHQDCLWWLPLHFSVPALRQREVLSTSDKHQSGMFQVCVLTLCCPLSPGQCPSQLASGERDVTIEPGTPRHDLWSLSHCIIRPLKMAALYIPCLTSACFTHTLHTRLTFLHVCSGPG